ncbi:MAG: hypothetical protein JF606_07785 [Burkholderiales bacterium]|nr:hypothetical protein [Burkholderiales bacterium]
MSATSLSFTFVNTYAPLGAKPVAASDTKLTPAPAAQEDNKASSEQRPGGGENRLVLAIMSALREIGLAGQAVAPAAATQAKSDPTTTATSATTAATSSISIDQAVATTPAPVATFTPNTAASPEAASEAMPSAADSAAAVESAVHQFAHELFSAMRQIGGGPDGNDHGHEGRHRGHEHHHRHGQRYGDMSQRLEALAQAVGGSAQAPVTGDTPTSAPVSSSGSITLAVQDGQDAATIPAGRVAAAPTQASTAASQSQTTTSATATSPATTPTPAAVPPKNALLDAFSKLFNANKPQSAGTTEPDMQGKLRTFLHTLAAAMQQPGATSIAPTPQIGSLLNITA